MNRLLLSNFVLVALLAACSAENAIVGGECAGGYEAEGGHCVRIPTPAASPAPSVPTTGPAPGGTITNDTPSGSSTSGSSGGPSTDATLPGSDAGTGGTTTIQSTSSMLQAATDPIVIVTPPAPPPALVCADDQIACHDTCVAPATDGQNCCACGRVCPSNICIDGVCQGATPGDIVVIGHDMAIAPKYTTHAKVFQNAVHLPTTDPLRVITFEADATDRVVSAARVLTEAAGPRSVTIGVATPVALEDTNLYASWDVVLIDGIASANAATYGGRWATALDRFTKKGGVLVALDSGDGDVPGFFSALGLLDLGVHRAIPAGTPFQVAAPNDTVGAQLLSPYAAFGASVAFDGASTAATWVVTSQTGDTTSPTVLHKVAR